MYHNVQTCAHGESRESIRPVNICLSVWLAEPQSYPHGRTPQGQCVRALAPQEYQRDCLNSQLRNRAQLDETGLHFAATYRLLPAYIISRPLRITLHAGSNPRVALAPRPAVSLSLAGTEDGVITPTEILSRNRNYAGLLPVPLA